MNTLDYALQIQDVCKSYDIYDQPVKRLLGFFSARARRQRREFHALKNITFNVAKGETVGVIGRNGSGKSTLLQIICGTLTPTQGSVRVNGRIAALLELGAGFNPEFTGRENVFLNAAIYGLTQEEIAAKLDDIIRFAEIGDFIDQPVQHYSSGMFVRLAFAVIAHVDADILVIDEALAVGDALFAQKCMRFLEMFKSKGAIIFVSHDSGAITKLCDRAVWLDRGEMQIDGDARKAAEMYLEHLYSTQQDVSMGQGLLKGDLQEMDNEEAWVDMRAELFLNSTERNDFQLHRFELDGSSFGTGKVILHDVYLKDKQGRRLSWAIGGHYIRFCVQCTPLEDIESFIVGFLVKDRLGQVLFGDNNCVVNHDNPVSVKAGVRYEAEYGFVLPYLPNGEYVASVGIASGTQADHIQHCWRHDAFVFTVTTSHVVHGLIGLPLRSCSIKPVVQEK